jgi:hypothetical protein
MAWILDAIQKTDRFSSMLRPPQARCLDNEWLCHILLYSVPYFHTLLFQQTIQYLPRYGYLPQQIDNE